MQLLQFLARFNLAVLALLTAGYFYQLAYTAIGLFRRAKPLPEPETLHRFAALVSARNEEAVIGELVRSLKAQDYPPELLDVYVLADNCTDGTASAAKRAGAFVYRRFDAEHIGKGFALDFLLRRIKLERGDVYDGYFVFDADNLVDKSFVREMNKTFSTGCEAVTCYRNSKNFGSGWIAACYSIWFLREARFLNFPRMLLGTSCAVSGTGFLVSRSLVEKNGGWPFHLLTEDIQFSVHCALEGDRIGYCDAAMVYDEQPTSFSQSWTQRLRWSKGFFQVDARYLLPLLRGAVGKKGRRLSCYDLMMTVAPCMFLTLLGFLVNLIILLGFMTQPQTIAVLLTRRALRYIGLALLNFYFGMLGLGALTVFSEWKRIPATAWEKLRYLWTFPLFMLTYVPVTLQALCCRVGWKHIEHYPAKAFAAAGK